MGNVQSTPGSREKSAPPEYDQLHDDLMNYTKNQHTSERNTIIEPPSPTDPNHKMLRKHMHRDIFTTYNGSASSRPVSVEAAPFEELYLKSRDSLVEPEVASPSVVQPIASANMAPVSPVRSVVTPVRTSMSPVARTTPPLAPVAPVMAPTASAVPAKKMTPPSRDLGRALRKIGRLTPNSDSDATVSSDGAGSYSPPTSVSSWSSRETEEEFASQRWSQENLPHMIKAAPRYVANHQPPVVRQRSKSVGSALKRPEDCVDFDFLPGTAPEQQAKEAKAHSNKRNTPAYMDFRTNTTASQPTFEYRQYRGRAASTHAKPRPTTPPSDDVDAGIPPRVPPHRIFSSPPRSPPKQAVEWVRTEKDVDVTAHNVYTRKCSYIQRNNTVMKSRAMAQDTPRQDQPLPRPPKRYGELESQEPAAKPMFVLPGYDQQMKLKVVNSDGSRSVSSSTIASVRTESMEQLTPPHVPSLAPATPVGATGSRRCTSVYDADPYQQYFFGADVGEAALDDLWTKRGQGFLQKLP